MRNWLFLLVLILLTPEPVAAQSVVINPTKVTQAVSPDHEAVFGGVPVLERYELVIQRGQTVERTIDGGKPTPVDGVVTFPLPPDLPRNVELTVIVRAVGPGGASSSELSDPFGWPGAPRAGGKPLPTR